MTTDTNNNREVSHYIVGKINFSPKDDWSHLVHRLNGAARGLFEYLSTLPLTNPDLGETTKDIEEAQRLHDFDRAMGLGRRAVMSRVDRSSYKWDSTCSHATLLFIIPVYY